MNAIKEEKIMKRIIAILLLASFMCLTACTADSSEKDSKDVTSEATSSEEVTEEASAAEESEEESVSPESEEESEESIEERPTPEYVLLHVIETTGSFGIQKSENKYTQDYRIVESTGYSNGKLSNRTVYEYDENFFLIAEYTYTYGTDEKINSYMKRTYVCSEEGLVLSGTTEINGAVGTFTREYDSEDRILCSKQFDENGTVIDQNDYTYLDDNGSYNRLGFRGITETLIYDEKGNMLEHYYTDAEGVVTSKSVCEYDEYDNITKSTDIDGAVTEYQNTYENNLLVKVVMTYNGEPGQTTEYTYDSAGQQASETVIGSDGTVTRQTTEKWIFDGEAEVY